MNHLAKSNRYWELLLKSWRADNKDGLTIPFIIGSQRFLPTKQSEQNIEELLVNIIAAEASQVYISYCPTINEIIFGLRDQSKENIAGKFPTFNSSFQEKLFLTEFLNDLGSDAEGVISKLTERYQPLIDDSKFSKNEGEWGDFSGNDIDFIKRCFASYV
ncbi:MAG: hypothetical protein HYR67_14255 [Bacteroidetes bacterium]|nr:hypothetical protein [Bacteroidota bacterium]